MLSDINAKLVISHSDVAGCLEDHKGKAILFDQMEDQLNRYSSDNLDTKPSPSHMAYVIYTSGSTGQPKGVMIQHGSLFNHMLWMLDKFDFTENDIILQRTSFSFDASVWEFFAPLLIGARLALYPASLEKDVSSLSRFMSDFAISIAQFTPSIFSFIQEERTSRSLASKLIFLGGDVIQEKSINYILQDHKTTYVNLYGPTESTIDVISTRVHKDCQSNKVLGCPIDNVKVYILDKNARLIPIGVVGELYIGGVGLARGYLNRPDLTAERFIPDPFSEEPGARLYRTGDLARYLPDGNIEYVGRIDHQVKIRGYRIELGEIESVLRKHPDIKDTVVIDFQETDHKFLVAYLVS
jgi:amino acid adenylation domain-containing protein